MLPIPVQRSKNLFLFLKLHFLIALTNYYTYLSRNQHTTLPMHMVLRSQSMDNDTHQHIYLLPQPAAHHAVGTPKTGDNDIFVYAPVPLSSMSPQEAQSLCTSATEAWISRSAPSNNSSSSSSLQTGRSHRHGHRRHGSSSSGNTGRISLPVAPGEGLLPAYEDSMRSLASSSVKA